MTTTTPAATRGGGAWMWILAIGGLGNVANGLWMLASPAGWYVGLPARVPDFGPLNEHFVRDIGAAFVTFGGGLLWGAFVPWVRVPVLLLATVFYGLHAVVHVFDTLRGAVDAAHWAIDFPGVYLPAVFLVVLTVLVARSQAEPA